MEKRTDVAMSAENRASDPDRPAGKTRIVNLRLARWRLHMLLLQMRTSGIS
jgi:hypothetical protein